MVSLWSSQDWTLSGQSLMPLPPPTCLCEPDGEVTPFPVLCLTLMSTGAQEVMAMVLPNHSGNFLSGSD